MSQGNVVSSDPPLFSAVITPHRSLTRTGFTVLMLAFGLLSMVTGSAFLALGAWPVFGFVCLDVACVYWAFRINFRSARAFEEVMVTPSELVVRKTSHRGEVATWTANPLWARLDRETHEEFGLLRLFVVSGGRRTAVASFLSPCERESFAAALAAAIGQAKRGPLRGRC